jgi:hypothetical protein
MSRVLQAVDSIHQVGLYCLALVPPNYLPKTPLGGIHLSETKRRFLEGALHPANVLLCPHTCVTNLPKPREIHSGEELVPQQVYYQSANMRFCMQLADIKTHGYPTELSFLRTEITEIGLITVWLLPISIHCVSDLKQLT